MLGITYLNEQISWRDLHIVVITPCFGLQKDPVRFE